MMTNKEKLEQLSEQIKKLTALTEEISERDIYPVSFFSQAYDITNTIQEELRQIELAQIELFEKQMKEHQAQILSLVPQQEYLGKQGKQENTEKQGESEKEEMLTEPSEHVQESLLQTPPKDILLHPFEGDVLESLPQTPLQQEKDTPANILAPISPTSPISPASPKKKDTVGEINRIDLKKVITLNDRFLFCRELFSNDENLMNRTISELNKIESIEASIDFIKHHFDWNIDDDYAADFIACVKRSFVY